MISAAAALALITLTQRDYCELSIDPYISIEDDVVAMRRLDPRIIDLMPPDQHFIAANTYYDEYLGFEGYFPWLDPNQIMPVTPPDHLARPREPGSDSAVEWESISVLLPDIDWPPDPYIRPGARFCMARPFHFKPSTPSQTPTPVLTTPTPAPVPTPTPESVPTSTSALTPTPNVLEPEKSTISPNVTTFSQPQPPLYKLSGFVVLAFAIGILAGSALSNRIWWQWRNRRNRKNFQTLLDDLAQQEAPKSQVRQRASGAPPPATHRLKKFSSLHTPHSDDLWVQPGAATEQSWLVRVHAFYWSCLLSVVQISLDWRSKVSGQMRSLSSRLLTFGQCTRVRRYLGRLTALRARRCSPSVSILAAVKKPPRHCPRVVEISFEAAIANPGETNARLSTAQLPTPPLVPKRLRVVERTVGISVSRSAPTSKGCQTTGVKRVCASVQTPQALASEDLPKRVGSLAGRGNHRTRRHNGNSLKQELITDNSDLDEVHVRVSPMIVPSAPTSPSTTSTAVCNRQSYDTSPPPGFEGGWHDHDEFLQTCQKLLDDMDNWDAPSGFAAASTETASTLGENDTSQDIHSLLFALTGKMDEDIAALLHNQGSRRCHSFN